MPPAAHHHPEQPPKAMILLRSRRRVARPGNSAGSFGQLARLFNGYVALRACSSDERR